MIAAPIVQTTIELTVIVPDQRSKNVVLSNYWARKIDHLSCAAFLLMLEKKYPHLIETAGKESHFKIAPMLELEEICWHWYLREYCRSLPGAKAPAQRYF